MAARAAAIAVGAPLRRHRLALALVCIVAAGLARAARKSATASVSASGARTVTACDYTVAEGPGIVRVESGARDAADAAVACSVTVSASASPAPERVPRRPLEGAERPGSAVRGRVHCGLWREAGLERDAAAGARGD